MIMLRWLLKGTEVTFPGRLLVVTMLASATLGAFLHDAGVKAVQPVIMHAEWRRIPFDLSDDWQRCLAAMQDAEIPGDVWECHEHPQVR